MYLNCFYLKSRVDYMGTHLFICPDSLILGFYLLMNRYSTYRNRYCYGYKLGLFLKATLTSKPIRYYIPKVDCGVLSLYGLLRVLTFLLTLLLVASLTLVSVKPLLRTGISSQESPLKPPCLRVYLDLKEGKQAETCKK